MKRPSSAASLVLAVSAVLVLAGPVAAGEQVPFKGRLEGVDTGVPIPRTQLVSVTVRATGNATHLGQFKETILLTLNPRTRIANGTFLFTAANGDTLFGTLSGKSTLTSPGVLTIVEKSFITGGTGRFAGSTGTFTAIRLKYVATNVTTGSFTGTISSPDRGN